MRRARVALWRMAGLFRRRHIEAEMTAELDSHLQMHVEDNLRSGMTREQARRAAILKLGGIETTKEAYRDARGIPLLGSTLQDTRFAVRQLLKNPAFSCVAILMLALGLCASVSIFAFVDAALIKPLPYAAPLKLVSVTETSGGRLANLSYPDYLDWKRLARVFDSLSVYNPTGYLLSSAAGSAPVPGVRVSDGFFRTLGIVPALGRDFYTGEDMAGTPNTVILSYATWQKRFGGTKDVIGKTIRLSEVPYTIVGVLPRSFQFAPRGNAEIWTPLHAAGSCDLRRSCHGLIGIARLRPGVSVQAAFQNMHAIAHRLEEQYPGDNRGQDASVLPLAEAIVGEIRPILLLLLGGGVLLLIIACVNVASLLLARSESRRQEIAVRGSLGASSLRLLTQFVTEALVLMAAGSLAGLISAMFSIKLLIKLIPASMLDGMPYLQGMGLDLHIAAFTLAIALLAAVLFAFIPSLHLRFSEMRGGLTEGTRGSAGMAWRRLGSNLVVIELAIAMVLLMGAGLLGKSLNRLLHVELGFSANSLATLSVAAPATRYAKDEQASALARRVLERVAALPGVKSAAVTSTLPVSFNGNTDWIRFVGRPYHGEHNEVNERDVSADYFKTIQARLLRGRDFTGVDDASKPRVVIINRALERKYFPGQDALGKRIADDGLTPSSIREIIGIVDDIREGGLDSEIWPAEYLAFQQSPDSYFSLIVRTAQSGPPALAAMQAAVHRVDPEVGTRDDATMSERINDSPSAYLHRSTAWLVGGFAGIALVLGVVGLYGVVAYSVSKRTREIGIRMALGAEPGSVHQLILREAGRLTAGGLAGGLVCSLAAATLLRKLLFGVSSWDVSTLIGVVIVLAVAALLASYIPARRAAAVNPIEALRAE